MTSPLSDLLNQPGAVLIEDGEPRRAFLFTDPVEILQTRDRSEILPLLDRMEERLRSGFHLAGYLGYDAGLVLDKVIASRHRTDVPLVWLGVYRDCRELAPSEILIEPESDPADLTEPKLNVSDEEYCLAVERVREYIAAGDVYQVNYTCKLRFENRGSATGLFARLRGGHPVPHSAFVNTGGFQVISISPELFLRREGLRLLTRPMKGTARRGRWIEEDEGIARWLENDVKNRAENVMIVDLMRNDVGRVAEIGGVSVPRLFHVERYGTLFQMTSDVAATLREGTGLSEILRATFSPGSVTGAPKIRALEIIDEMEKESRGVYCGSIGRFQPGGDFVLNVAIRTIVQRGTACEMGVGSGIVHDSQPREELAETRLKGHFVQSTRAGFEMLETLLWKRGQRFVFVEEHLERMRNSARYFGWRFPEQELRAGLDKAGREIGNVSPGCLEARVRLLLCENGTCRTEWSDLTGRARPAGSVRLCLAARRTDANDRFLYHKTTNRHAYDADFHEAQGRGFFDLLYLNTRGEITEGAITNVRVELDGQWLTPPLGSGLLPGIWRAKYLAGGGTAEGVLTLDDLGRASRVQVGNSVRGTVDVNRVEQEGETLFEAGRSKWPQ
ncbi:aminodeoxychorismate synthase component I [bacterium]|nr:aminodeoxychorismate synthase component I [bacterium]